jgi:anti-sigma regulatory factor (Ser/Thr protein kinase)
MEDLSLHILDIAENSISAGARNITITLREDAANDLLRVEIADDGSGMSEDVVARAADPFYTTRSTRRVGLGLALLHEAARMANGSLEISSAPGRGTTVKAALQMSHIDRKPLGNMAETVIALIAMHAGVDILYEHTRDGKLIAFDTKEVRNELGGASLNTVEALSVIREYLNQEEESLAQ